MEIYYRNSHNNFYNATFAYTTFGILQSLRKSTLLEINNIGKELGYKVPLVITAWDIKLNGKIIEKIKQQSNTLPYIELEVKLYSYDLLYNFLDSIGKSLRIKNTSNISKYPIKTLILTLISYLNHQHLIEVRRKRYNKGIRENLIVTKFRPDVEFFNIDWSYEKRIKAIIKEISKYSSSSTKRGMRNPLDCIISSRVTHEYVSEPVLFGSLDTFHRIYSSDFNNFIKKIVTYFSNSIPDNLIFDSFDALDDFWKSTGDSPAQFPFIFKYLGSDTSPSVYFRQMNIPFSNLKVNEIQEFATPEMVLKDSKLSVNFSHMLDRVKDIDKDNYLVNPDSLDYRM